MLEHVYGATLLAALLVGDSTPGLGDDQVVQRVAFQSRHASVDDFLIDGSSTRSGGRPRRLAVGARRNPKIAPSSGEFVSLLVHYLRDVNDYWDDVQRGEWRLGLAVATPSNGGIRELSSLTDFAKTQPSAGEFRDEIRAGRSTTERVRRRLDLLDAAVARAFDESAIHAPEGGVSELTWRILVALQVIPLELEGATSGGRSATVARLRSVADDDSSADSIFSELCGLASRYAPLGAVVDGTMLRRDLAGVARLGRAQQYRAAWSILDALNSDLRDRIRGYLRSSMTEPVLTLERRASLDQLVSSMETVGANAGVLVVSGDPDVGKSALTLHAIDALVERGAKVTALSLRDLPTSFHEMIALLDAPFADVLGSQAVATVRLLVIDGAEAVLEGKDGLLRSLASSARQSGIGLVAVTRTDARLPVANAVTATGLNASNIRPVQFDVGGLTPQEVIAVTDAFPALSRFAGDARSASLLTRLGLIEVIINAEVFAALPSGALSESDVFDAVWSGLVRRPTGDASPDTREGALLDIARRQLLPLTPHPLSQHATALASLRSDGLVLGVGSRAAWRQGDEFGSDLIRDFSVAHLLLREGFSQLREAGGPRWALRAARLACQACLANAGADVEDTRGRLQTEFDAIAAQFGDRWSDLPMEALLTLGAPSLALENAWPALADQLADGLHRLLRLVRQRYTRGGAADPELVAPVIELLLNHDQERPPFGHGLRETESEVKRLWLRGLALRGRSDHPDPLRVRLRDQLLAGAPERGAELQLECLALLGPDLDDATEAHLRRLAASAPAFLEPCVGPFAVGLSMSAHRPQLLLALADAYYIDRTDPWTRGYSPWAEGVRDHYRLGGGGDYQAAWHHGPFYHLLRSVPREAVPFINDLLDHAARARVRGDATPRETPDHELSGCEFDFPSIGTRYCVGDDHVWAWYRGSTVGPRVCMSALLAVERFIDEVFATRTDLPIITTLLLTDCHNLAMVGLLVGFLVRRIEEVSDELDPWLEKPSAWDLEFSRASLEGEGTLHVQGPDPIDLSGRERRQYSLREASAELIVRALRSGDRAQLDHLAAVADALMAHASAETADVGTSAGREERLAVVWSWAAFLRASSYRAVDTDGASSFEFTPPAEGAEIRAAAAADLARTMDVMHLLNTYARVDDRQPLALDNLRQDIALAIELIADPQQSTREFMALAVSALAATALLSHARGRADLGREDLSWAFEALVANGVTNLQLGPFEYEGSEFSMGADRSAALAVPVALLPIFTECDPPILEQRHIDVACTALLQLATSLSNETRRLLASALKPVWDSPCTDASSTVGCRHAVGLRVIEASIRDCRLGAVDRQSGRRAPIPLTGPVAESLDRVLAEDLLVSRLSAGIVGASDCAAARCCVSPDAARLRDALLRAYRRGSIHHARAGYQSSGDGRRAVAGVLLRLAVRGDLGPLQSHVDAAMDDPAALHEFLSDLAEVATYDAEQRVNLRLVWPMVLRVALDAIAGGRDPRRSGSDRSRYRRDDAIASLVPYPRASLTGSRALFERARIDWLPVDGLAALIDEWLPLAAGSPECIDALVRLLETAPLPKQATQGFDWIFTIADGRFESVANHTWELVEWLGSLLAQGALNEVQLSRCHVLIDGLAACGDHAAVRLQRSQE